MEDGDRYNLQYRTAGDDRMRPEHTALNGVTLPPSDDFWESYYPPNGWRCRCTVVQVRKKKHPATPHDEAMALGEAALERDTKGMFRFNPGKQERVFPAYNAYTISDCQNCDQANQELAWRPDRTHCRVCLLLRQCYQEKMQENASSLIRYTPAQKHAIYSMPLNDQFEEVFTGTHGGKVKRHVLRQKEEMDYERVLDAAALYADKETVLMLPEIHISETSIRQTLNLPGKSNPDLLVGSVFVDVKSPYSENEISQNACRAFQQGAIACITDDHCVLRESMLDQYARRVLHSQGYGKTEVHFVINGVLYKYNSQGRILG